MNERPAPAETDARRWACATMGVAEDAPVDVVRAAFLKQVGEADFYPSSASVVAWQSLTGATAANPRARQILADHVNHELRTQVEQFAERFFSTGVAERVRHWFDLNSRCQSSAALAARLERLSAGLHIDREAALASLAEDEAATSDATPSERAVAAKTFELFVLRPVDRAERQQELLETWQTDLNSWQLAARQFKRRLPKIAELDSDFIDTLIDTGQPAPRASTTRMEYQVTSAQPATNSSRRSWPVLIAVFLALMCVSAISRCSQERDPLLLPSGQRLTPAEMEDIKRLFNPRGPRKPKPKPKPKPTPTQANDESPTLKDSNRIPAENRSQGTPSETTAYEESLAQERARLEREVDRNYFQTLPDRISPDAPPARTETSPPIETENEPAPDEQR